MSRWAQVYTFMELPRRNPTRVRPASSASSAASDDGADTAARTGMPAVTAFWTSSNEARPLTSRREAGQRQLPLAQRPADHLVDGIVPADVLAQRQQLAIGREQPGRVQPGQHGGPQPELIGGKIKIRQNG